MMLSNTTAVKQELKRLTKTQQNIKEITVKICSLFFKIILFHYRNIKSYVAAAQWQQILISFKDLSKCFLVALSSSFKTC